MYITDYNFILFCFVLFLFIQRIDYKIENLSNIFYVIATAEIGLIIFLFYLYPLHFHCSSFIGLYRNDSHRLCVPRYDAPMFGAIFTFDQ